MSLLRVREEFTSFRREKYRCKIRPQEIFKMGIP
jgi:hypothetical protein